MENLEIKKQFASAIQNTTIEDDVFLHYEEEIKGNLIDWLYSFSKGLCGPNFFENENYCNYLHTNGVESAAMLLVQNCTSLINEILPRDKNDYKHLKINWVRITRIAVLEFGYNISKKYSIIP